jgi:alkanesulfonate monooxygenase SsuD/methylene tetrahydromethanopterin reductase-like flavin-dependent oxidoreductase (luciferase family)
MEFGLFSESGRRTSSPAQAFAEDVAEIVLADKLGFHEAWIAEPNNDRETSVTQGHMLMCKAAGLTKRIKLGSGIRQLPLHHPVDVVQEANMCDQVTQGRYIFGYGGTHLVTHEQLDMRGIDVRRDETRAMVYESIDLILKCWRSPEPFDFQGEFWHGKNIEVLPRSYQQPHPPIAAGCSGSTETLELAGSHGFIPLMGRGSDTPEEIRRYGEIYTRAAEAAGQTVSRRSFHVARVMYVAETDEQALEEARPGLSELLQDRKKEPIYLMKRLAPGQTLDDITYEYMVDTGAYWVGSPDTVYQRIKDYYDASGGFGMLLIYAGLPIAPQRKLAKSMRLIMEKIAPRVASLDPDLVPAGVR